MFIENVSIETIRVGETLGPGAFPDADNSVLLWMKNSSLKEKARYTRPIIVKLLCGI